MKNGKILKKEELGRFTALNNEDGCGRIGCKLQVVLAGYCPVQAGHKAVTLR